MVNKHLMAIVRDETGKMVSHFSDTNRFKSERDLSDYLKEMPVFFKPPWFPDRIMMEVPLFISNEQVFESYTTQDYIFLPQHLKNILQSGLIRTSGNGTTEYSVIMSVNEGYDATNPPEGRTGALLYKGEPVIVRINEKDFLVEIKGVGCPDGKNNREDPMVRSGFNGESRDRYGSVTISEGMDEYRHLEIERRERTSNFNNGEGVRIVGIFNYKNTVPYTWDKNLEDQSFLIRLSPSNVRSSFNTNSAFPHVPNRETRLVESVAQHWSELAKLPETLIHGTIHPENILWTGNRYVLTDFADSSTLKQIERPHQYLADVLKDIKQVPKINETHINLFYATVAQELGAQWEPQTGYSGLINSLWSSFFAKKVFNLRLNGQHAVYRIEGIKNYIKEYGLKKTTYFLARDPINFLEEEVDMLQHIDTPVAQKSVSFAKDRLESLKTQIEKPVQLKKMICKQPDTYYDLFILPYMQIV